MQPDRPLLGLALMLGFCVLAPLGDALAKILTATVALVLILLARFAVQGVLLLPFLLARGLPSLNRTAWGLLTLRTGLHLTGIALMFLSLRYLPLAEAIAIAYVMPFIALLLGWSVLGEQVGARRLTACAIGFAGTLMVVQPTFALVGWPALLPLGVAVIFALFMLLTRMIVRDLDPVRLQAVNGLQGTAILAVVIGLSGTAVTGHGITVSDAALLAGVGVVGTAAHLALTWSLRFAPAATVAPIQYLEIPVATALGWAIFAQLPNGLASLGIVVTMLAGLFVIHRERQLV